MYYTLWEMKDMEKRGLDKVCFKLDHSCTLVSRGDSGEETQQSSLLYVFFFTFFGPNFHITFISVCINFKLGTTFRNLNDEIKRSSQLRTLLKQVVVNRT